MQGAQDASGQAVAGLTFIADGTYVFQGPQDFHGTLTFTYAASDGAAVSDTATVTLAVAPVNDAPTAPILVDLSSPEEEPLAFTVPTFADVDGDALAHTATLASGAPLPAWLAFDAATRSFSGQPPAGWSGTLDLRIAASDGRVSASDTFRLTITPVNDAPVAAPDAVAVAEDATTPNLWATLLGNDVDGDGDDLAIVGASPTSVLGGTISFDAATQRLTYTADADVLDLLTAGQTRTDSFTYTVSDGHGGVVTATASVTVTGVVSGLVGGSGADVLAGTFEDDTMRGEAGDDRLWGDAGNDTLLGGAGHDQLDGGTGRDRLEGGEGDDRFIVDGAGDAVVERGTAARTRWTQASASRWALGSRTSC